MFSNLTNMNYKRSVIQAIGFYIASLFLIILASIALGAVAEVVFGMGYDVGVKIGIMVAVLATLLLSVLIAKSKNIIKDFKVIVVIIAAPLVSVFAGGIGGLLFVSYLTTLKSNA